MRDVFILGAAMTPFGRHADETVRTMATSATLASLADAGLDARDVGMTFFANAVAGLLDNQEMIRGQVALRETGLLGPPIVNVENACASASTAFHLACMAVGSGAVDIAIAIGSEQLSRADKELSFAAIGTAVDQERLPELRRWAANALDAGSVTDDDLAKRSFFMDIYAAKTRAYMQESGATAVDFAEVAVKNRAHAAANPNAQFRNPMTVDDVLASREVAAPLTLLMCSPIGDGAASLVVGSADAARTVGASTRVRASVLVSGREIEHGETGAAERAAQTAYEQAAIGPDELNVVELHDAAAPAELMTYEELGMCAPGAGPKLLASGATALGGRVPTNVSGGLLSKGHPIGATGCAQLVELADQLRGRGGPRQVDGARVGLAHNAGGFLGEDAAATVITILEQQR
jgi:acetyl-CoA acyltransferase